MLTPLVLRNSILQSLMPKLVSPCMPFGRQVPGPPLSFPALEASAVRWSGHGGVGLAPVALL